MPGTKEEVRKYRQRLRKRARALIGSACIWCGTTKEVEAAHVLTTALSGASRGMSRRYIDVIRNPTHYRPMCREHHLLFDSLAAAAIRDLLNKAAEVPF